MEDHTFWSEQKVSSENSNCNFQYQHFPSIYFHRDKLYTFELTARKIIEPTGIEIKRLTGTCHKKARIECLTVTYFELLCASIQIYLFASISYC